MQVQRVLPHRWVGAVLLSSQLLRTHVLRGRRDLHGLHGHQTDHRGMQSRSLRS